MNRKSVLRLLLESVFVIVFNIVFFVAGGTSHEPAVWIAYGFIHFAYLMVLITPLLVGGGGGSAVFSLSIYTISGAYFLVEFLVGLIFILFLKNASKPSLLVQIVLAGIYAIVLISNLLPIVRHEREVSYVKSAALKVKPLIDQVEDKRAKQAIERAYDALRACPMKSHSAVMGVEMNIQSTIEVLRDAVEARRTEEVLSAAAQLLALVQARNLKLQQLN